MRSARRLSAAQFRLVNVFDIEAEQPGTNSDVIMCVSMHNLGVLSEELRDKAREADNLGVRVSRIGQFLVLADGVTESVVLRLVPPLFVVCNHLSGFHATLRVATTHELHWGARGKNMSSSGLSVTMKQLK